MILDNSGIDYLRMLLFVLGFLVYWKIEPNYHALNQIEPNYHAIIRTWFQSGHIKIVKKTKCDVTANF